MYVYMYVVFWDVQVHTRQMDKAGNSKDMQVHVLQLQREREEKKSKITSITLIHIL